MKKYLNKYTITALVMLVLIIAFGLKGYGDRAYLTACLQNESLEMYIISEASGEILTNKSDDEQNDRLSSAEEKQLMAYLQTFKFGTAFSKEQSADSKNNWYGIYLYNESQEMIYFAVYDYERSNTVQCRKFTRHIKFNPEFISYLDGLFSQEQLY